jgi:hypothetical protein
MYDLVITNGVCATATDVAPLDIAIKDEKIVLLAPSGSLASVKSVRIIDAEGGYVMVSEIYYYMVHRLFADTSFSPAVSTVMYTCKSQVCLVREAQQIVMSLVRDLP